VLHDASILAYLYIKAHSESATQRTSTLQHSTALSTSRPCSSTGSFALCCAGQAIVQFAQDRRTKIEYAAKFFVSAVAFADEAALYTDPDNPLGEFLPQLRNLVDNASGEMLDARGRPFPPCIVMEKGESLDVWRKRSRDGLDMVTGLQVCPAVVCCEFQNL
jgi:hypothetical protein